MGSTGSGRLSDYSNQPPKKEQATGGGSGGSGGSPGGDPCALAFTTTLADVERCDYVKTQGNPPGKGDPVRVIFDTRLCVVTDDGVLIGYLYRLLGICCVAVDRHL